MSISRTDPQAPPRVDESAAFSRGWLTVDLGGLPQSVVPKSAPALPAPILAAPLSDLGPSAPVVPDVDPAEDGLNDNLNPVTPVEASPESRVPVDSFVVIGSRLTPRSVGRRRVVPPIANDNARSPGRKGRSVLREVFFLCVLAATVVGAFLSGRVHAMQKVIVVPEPVNSRSILT